ncbi:nucleoporin-like protein 2-like [Arapaima gigas]
MTVCNFFLQGRCRYGEKCWNEHPRGSGGGGYGGHSNRAPQQSGFGNRVWVNPSQTSSSRDYVASSSFSRGGNDWGRGGEGSGRDLKSSNFTFSSENRYSALDTHHTMCLLSLHVHGFFGVKSETVQKDMDIWENSGQWLFSCYSILKASIPGFPEYSPEELRLEYYKCREMGNLQTYVSSVQQLVSQWRNRVQELKNLNSTSLAKVVSTIIIYSYKMMTEWVALSVGFSGTDSNGFSFAPSSSGFGSLSTTGAPTGFGSLGSMQPAPLFGSSASPSSGVSSSSVPSASSFSFTVPLTNKEQPTGFGNTSDAGFSFSSPRFGNSFGSAQAVGPTMGQGSSVFGGSSTGTGNVMMVAGVASIGCAADKLFTPQSELTPEELKEFRSKRFSLGQIPLKPPPADLLIV